MPPAPQRDFSAPTIVIGAGPYGLAAAALLRRSGIPSVLASLPQPKAQELMKGYLRDTAENGELPLYQPGGYAAALQRGDAATGKEEVTA